MEYTPINYCIFCKDGNVIAFNNSIEFEKQIKIEKDNNNYDFCKVINYVYGHEIYETIHTDQKIKGENSN